MARTTVILCVLMFTMTGVARAQEKGQTGLVIGYPASVGLLWHVSSGFAVRPDVTWTRTSGETTTTGSGFVVPSSASNTNWSASFGLSLLFYLHQWETLRVYVSPRFAYARTHSTNTNTNTTPLPGGSTTVTETLTATYTAVGSFGTQYSLGRKFAVFGEIGMAYIDIESSARLVGARVEGTSRTVGTRSGVGVIFYF